MEPYFNKVLLLGLLLISVSCTNQTPVFTNDVVINEYPKLAEAIVERDANRLLSFTKHSSEEVRSLSWQALAKSEIETFDPTLDFVIEGNEHAGWLALSFHELYDKNLQRIRNIYSGNPNQYIGACELFRRQGAESDLEMILTALSELEDKNLCSTAAGRIMTRAEVSNENHKRVIDAAFDAGSPTVRRNLLYGMYRSPLNRPDTQSDLGSLFMNHWTETGIGADPMLDQYMIGILGSDGAELFLDLKPNIEEFESQQLIIEIIRAMDMSGGSTGYYNDLVERLLDHKNPAVVLEMLEKLKQAESVSENLLQNVYRHQVAASRNHNIFIAGLELVQSNGWNIDPMMRKLAFVEDQSPYLTNRILSIYKEAEPASVFLDRVEEYIADGGIRGLHAVQVLTEFWIGLTEESETVRIRNIVRNAAGEGDRSVISALNTLLTDEDLVRNDDYEWLQNRYSESVSENIRENILAFEQALESRFPDQYEQLSQPADTGFRIPDWQRLYEMGTRPYWHLETEKGTLVIRLDPLTAPFTVSSVDSLTRAGAYDGVAFHRVVHNFVIQGGDVGRGDGFGGPGYRIPTEPSLKSFKRGAVGIASSGTDTEGSQYFVMHQWKPHLDGDYTLFGAVVRGMDVADQIHMGDRVLKASISVH